MIMDKKVKTIGIVSLSRGIIGESFVKHELDIGVSRLEKFGLKVKFMDHALKGLEYINNHPEMRAKDLIQAYQDPDVDMILCAIGGDDTYRLLPYLFENDELKKVVNDKIFLGFSDTTLNHLMLNRVGACTFYGQAFLPDICELSKDMLPYTKKYFEELITTGMIKTIEPSALWYEERKSFGEDQIGVELPVHKNYGFELLQGKSSFSGKILGGCIDSIFDIFDDERYKDMPSLCKKYNIFPSKDEWRGKILLLESSEEKMSPEKYKQALEYIKEAGVFDVINGVLIGKPMDETYFDEYKQALIEVIDNPKLPIVCNINIGHAKPRCIIPFGKMAHVDANKQQIKFDF